MEQINTYISLFNEHPDNNMFGNLLPLSVITTDRYSLFKSKVLNDGQILIGKNNDEPQIKGITGTNKQVIITHNPNNITFGLPQDLDLDSTPTFNNLKLDGLTGPYLVATDNMNNLQSLTTSSNNGVISGITGSSFVIDTPQDIRITSSPTFNNINVNNIDCTSILSTGDIKSNTNVVGNQLVATGLTYNRLVGGATGGALQSLTTSSNNGVIVGLTGSTLTIDTPQDLRITAIPTFNNLWFTGAPFSVGQLTLWMNQSVKTDSSPQFNNLTVSNNIVGNQLYGLGLTTNRIVGVGATGLIQSLTATSSNGVSTTVSGTTLTISTPQDLRTTASPNFTGLSVSGTAIVPANLVMTNTTQVISGQKTFTGNIRVGSEFNSKLIMPYYGNANYIESNIPHDSNHFMEFVLRSTPIFRISNGYPGSGRDRWFEYYGTRFITTSTNDATSRTSAPVLFSGGVGVAKTLYANAIDASSISINGNSINLSNLVTTNTTQTITGTKTFSAQTSFTNGIILPNLGAPSLPHLLNNYEVWTTASYFKGDGGTISHDLYVNIKITKIGYLVSMDVVHFPPTWFTKVSGTPQLVLNTAIPERFRPIDGIRCHTMICKNNSTYYDIARVWIRSDNGLIQITTQTGFNGSTYNESYIDPFNLTYMRLS